METVTTDLRARWCGFKAHAQATWFWRVFGVCAMRKLWTKFLVAVAIYAGFWFLYIGVDLLNPILPLEKLNRTEGALVHVYQPLRNVYGAKVRIRTASGEEITYRGTMYDDAEALLLAMKGKQVTVWSQPYYEVWLPFYYNRFWRVQDGDRVLLKDDTHWIGRNHMRPTDIRLLKLSLALTISCVGIVILACRKGVPAE
ncbi:MAG: hypothetical protein Q8M09_06860 [Pseudomonadota bacterium]|nr:hypothetical protein [Pseudomonadota bacterium]MDP1903948.1 hypothetical protein [Pseudomonadota bacterium]MDP2351993.1 hypothetical protein [Pseudomonadota bacterium]